MGQYQCYIKVVQLTPRSKENEGFFADNFTRQGLNTAFQLLAAIAFANVYEQITATNSTSTPKRKI